MHRKWYTTLRLFLGFVAVSGLLDFVFSIPYIVNGEVTDGLAILFLALDLVYVIGGGYLFFCIDTLLPHHRKDIVRYVTAAFALEVLFSLAAVPSALMNESLVDPGLPVTEASWWIMAGAAVGVGFAYLVYSIIVSNINLLSGVRVEPDPRRTFLYWVIVAAFVLYVGALMLSPGPTVM